MSFQMVHMEIAYRLSEQIRIPPERDAFILGSVAPDSVHFREPYRVEDKIHTHLFENCGPWGDTQDYEQWIDNMNAFWDRCGRPEKDAYRRSFLLGIYVHCMTDYYNDLLIWRRLQRKFIPPMTMDAFKEDFYREAQLVDKWLFQESAHSGEISKLLAASAETDYEDYIRAVDLKKMKKHLLEEQYYLTKRIEVSGFHFYPSEMLKEFIETVTRKILEKLQ